MSSWGLLEKKKRDKPSSFLGVCVGGISSCGGEEVRRDLAYCSRLPVLGYLGYLLHPSLSPAEGGGWKLDSPLEFIAVSRDPAVESSRRYCKLLTTAGTLPLRFRNPALLSTSCLRGALS